MKFIYNNPFFRILLAFIAGIILYVFAAQTLWVAITLIVCALVLLLPSVIVKNPSHQFTLRWTFGLGVIFFFTGIGFVLSKWESEQNTFSELNKRAVFLIELTDNPIQKAKSYKCKVQVLTCYTLRGPVSVNKNALIYLQKSENAALLKHGNRLLIQTTFKEAPGKINPEGFDYKHYLQLQGIGAMAYADSLHWRKMAYTPQFSIMQMASGAQKSLVDIYARYGISGNEYAVLSALTLGYTDELQPEIMAGYSASGAMHILSVSGLHVGIVYMVISFLLSFIRKNRFLIIVKAVFIVIFLWLYAFTTGLSPSVIRSAAMFSFVAIGSAFNRKSQIFNTIFASAFLILLTNPLLLFNVGFQLSYTAVISIIIFQPTFSALLPTKNKPLKWVRDLFAVSIAAQIGTLPLTLYYFQQFPNYFLLTNLLAIPLSGLIIYVAMFLQATAVIPFIATITAQILKYLLFALNYCINFIYKLPNSVTIISLDIIQSILFIVGTSLIVSYVIRKKAN
ncbi:MAG: ComEC/Rec2 family competence protein, partial [Paludibacter sp.]